LVTGRAGRGFIPPSPDAFPPGPNVGMLTLWSAGVILAVVLAVALIIRHTRGRKRGSPPKP